VRVPFHLPEDLDPTAAFRELLKSLPRKTILANANEQGRRSLLFLLPAISDPATVESVRAVFAAFGETLALGESFRPHFITTLPGESPQQLWGRLLADNQDLASR
jgi:hypothetical protein